MTIEVIHIADTADRDHAYAIRMRVFVEEQRVPADIELDDADRSADHFLARLDGRPVGTARLVTGDRPDGPVAVLGRLAVLPETRGTGLGAALVHAVEERALARGLTDLELHAQVDARPFYERLGYTSYGPQDMEAGIPHVWMRRRLT